MPVLRDEIAVGVERIDIGGQGQGHHVCGQPIDHRACLFPGSAMRLLDDEIFPGLGLVFFGESLIESLI